MPPSLAHISPNSLLNGVKLSNSLLSFFHKFEIGQLSLNLYYFFLAGFSSRFWGWHIKKIILHSTDCHGRQGRRESCASWRWRLFKTPYIYYNSTTSNYLVSFLLDIHCSLLEWWKCLYHFHEPLYFFRRLMEDQIFSSKPVGHRN